MRGGAGTCLLGGHKVVTGLYVLLGIDGLLLGFAALQLFWVRSDVRKRASIVLRSVSELHDRQ
jgi:hypothetical protein